MSKPQKLTQLEENEVKIGLEIHIQLTALKTKLFCGCSSDYRGKEPNSLLCPVCLGLPGSLPVTNKRAIDLAIMVALALNSNISRRTLFFRKNYFYVDMPKNFQISQYDKAGGVPLSTGGWVDFESNASIKRVGIIRLQIEEDPARLAYHGTIDSSPYTLVDYNRAGIALLEIVTEPDIDSADEARLFLQKLRSIIEHLGVSNGDLQGSMRCDANISLKGGKRVEIKNISSFREVKRALQYEIIRQKQLIRRGSTVKQETRHWDEDRRITISLRTKETESDYRYFPEPDLVPIEISKTWIEKIQSKMPELPDARKTRLVKEFDIPEYDAGVLTSSKALADFFEECCKLYPDAKKISNWMMTDLARNLKELGIEISESKIKPKYLSDMLKLIDKGEISGKIAKKVLSQIVGTGDPPQKIIIKENLTKISDKTRIQKIIDKVFEEFPKAVQDTKTDPNAINYLVGQVMSKTRGKADPEITNKLIRKKLAKYKTI
ncbi:MAG: Asp-tRNA(Asn)/Glu-tRNA(Gln) amidotransferase subunit GatB [Candidatus Jordarchaeum sp.]|uniref:Asp-tRNA(Asn)/Glu-tRNA(Gln) amidotransferase subunit GatB n=1 Tax=Candidatus Jordarchaeum sp. TaxID=2823881 RepID=UPI00404A9104